METLQKALTDICCSEEIVLPDEVVEQVENSLSEAQIQLQEAEDFLKQALTGTGPSEVLQQHVAQVTSDLEVTTNYMNKLRVELLLSAICSLLLYCKLHVIIYTYVM